MQGRWRKAPPTELKQGSRGAAPGKFSKKEDLEHSREALQKYCVFVSNYNMEFIVTY